jgi:hypothetical protein
MTFWTLILGGIFAMLQGLVTGNFALHTTFNLVGRTTELLSSSLSLVALIILSNFNMLLPFTTFLLISAAEVVRVIYSAWRWVKGLII